jgi:RecA-family ATPase
MSNSPRETLDQMRARVAAEVPLTKRKAKTKGNGLGAPAQERFEILSFDKIRLDTTPAYLVKGIIPRVGLCVFWGPPKCGKSFLVFDLMMHVALGWKFRDLKVRQGSVVYCALEGCAAFKNRVEAFRQAKLAEDISGVPFHLMASPMQLVTDHPTLIASIREQAARPAAVVIDTLNRSLTGSESSDEDMSAYVKAADVIRDAFGLRLRRYHHSPLRPRRDAPTRS